MNLHECYHHTNDIAACSHEDCCPFHTCRNLLRHEIRTCAFQEVITTRTFHLDVLHPEQHRGPLRFSASVMTFSNAFYRYADHCLPVAVGLWVVAGTDCHPFVDHAAADVAADVRNAWEKPHTVDIAAVVVGILYCQNYDAYHTPALYAPPSYHPAAAAVVQPFDNYPRPYRTACPASHPNHPR